MKKHFLVRFLIGTLPILFIFYDILTHHKNGPDNFFPNITIAFFLGFIFMIIWAVWILIESIFYFSKDNIKKGFVNIIIFIVIFGCFIFEMTTPTNI